VPFEIAPAVSSPNPNRFGSALRSRPRSMLFGHQADPRPDEKVFQSPTSATSAVATIGPTPKISSSRRLSSLEQCQAWIRFSMAKISAMTTAFWRARTSTVGPLERSRLLVPRVPNRFKNRSHDLPIAERMRTEHDRARIGWPSDWMHLPVSGCTLEVLREVRAMEGNKPRFPPSLNAVKSEYKFRFA
jgi:hypothetical protein